MNRISSFMYACPNCGAPLQDAAPEALRCPAEDIVYRQVEGIWRFLPPEANAAYAQFTAEYQQVRKEEGRGSNDPAYYRALPFRDLTGRFAADWHIRAVSYQALVGKVVAPLEDRLQRPLRAADLGAGTGWLSYRLALRRHLAAAVDLLTNSLDGLGAWPAYDAGFVPIQADFNSLPFQSGQLDLVVFNASLHYSTRYEVTLCEAWRLVRPGGALVILDSPVYSNAESGRQMVAEREAAFQKLAGFPSNALPSENYLTYTRLEELSQVLGVPWRLDYPFYGLGWTLRPWKARLRGGREPARFALITAWKPGEEH
jgi:SAM-dependent methyltransferase